MPMYYPDLESVKKCCIVMSEHNGERKYTGIIPETEDDLIQARKELASYFRLVWHDNIAAIEVEQAVTKENYEEKLSCGMMLDFANALR